MIYKKLSFLAVVALFFISFTAQATHWRFGQLTWKPAAAANTAEFTLTAAFRLNGNYGLPGTPVVGDVITEFQGGTGLSFGDGSSTGTLQFQVISVDPANNWLIGIALQPGSTSKTTIDHAYATQDNAGSPWIAEVASCCRTSGSQGEVNNPGGSYRIATQVELVSGNRSPVSNLPAIVNMAYSANASFLMLASDPDPNTVLTYRLATSSEAKTSGTFNQPNAGGNALSVNSATGLVSWNTTGALLNRLYSCQIIVEDRDAITNAIRTTIAIDLLLYIVNCSPGNTAPSFVSPSPTCGNNFIVAAGDPLSFAVAVADADAGDNVILNTGGVPTGASMSPSLPISGASSVSSTFTWNTSLADVGNNYVVSYTATDNCGVQSLCSYSISVVPCSIDASAIVSNLNCNDDNSGAIDLTLSGNFGNPTFSWTGPNGFTANSEDISGLEAGTYSVTASGDFGLGCSVTKTYTITEPGPIAVVYSASPILCNGGLSQESITITGGTAPYNVINQNGGPLVSGLGEGVLFNSGQTFAANYVYTVTDANSCTYVFNADITEPTAVSCQIDLPTAISGGVSGTVYPGYAPDITLTANPSGGTPGYTYSWSTSQTGSSITVSPTSTTTYTLTTTDANLCTSTCNMTINVVDVSCGKKGNKVLVCKVPPGNPGNAHNICVSSNAVASHLATGSYLGPCASNKTQISSNVSFDVYPNPNNGNFNLELELFEESKLTIQVMDMRGNIVYNEVYNENSGHYQHNINLEGISTGIYLVSVSNGETREMKKINVSH